ncbi:hypothetical protein [Spiroplasma poulsonii]|uniref:hypothetical protein n=1 Tax=Spiroplasma poulsonii TaxID=2138 RepID=UPI001F4C8D56|nr:hypothetical protein [Spiroplasma poulsonii]UNF62526.1 hypothetical protein MNU24_03460 [Spiroplasma poulsonii]
MIILMIKLYYWCYRNSIQHKKDKKQSYSGKRKTHSQNTSNYQTRNQKLLQQVFARKKHDYAFI